MKELQLVLVSPINNPGSFFKALICLVIYFLKCALSLNVNEANSIDQVFSIMFLCQIKIRISTPCEV